MRPRARHNKTAGRRRAASIADFMRRIVEGEYKTVRAAKNRIRRSRRLTRGEKSAARMVARHLPRSQGAADVDTSASAEANRIMLALGRLAAEASTKESLAKLEVGVAATECIEAAATGDATLVVAPALEAAATLTKRESQLLEAGFAARVSELKAEHAPDAPDAPDASGGDLNSGPVNSGRDDRTRRSRV